MFRRVHNYNNIIIVFFRSQPVFIPEAGSSQPNQGCSKAPAKRREKRFLKVPQEESSPDPLSSASETIIPPSDDHGKVSKIISDFIIINFCNTSFTY